MTNLQKLTSIIQEIVPDIMELKEGCEIRCYSDFMETQTNECDTMGEYNFDEIVKIRDDDNFIEYDCCEYSFDDIKLGRCGDVGDADTVYFEILGSPITIAIVLRALARHKGVNPELELFSIQLSIGGQDNCLWNLAQDDLSLQNEETITNLLKIFEV
jgi:hypothetical protein